MTTRGPGTRAAKPERERRRDQLYAVFMERGTLSAIEAAALVGCPPSSAHSILVGLERYGFLVSFVAYPPGGGRRTRYFRLPMIKQGGKYG